MQTYTEKPGHNFALNADFDRVACTLSTPSVSKHSCVFIPWISGLSYVFPSSDWSGAGICRGVRCNRHPRSVNLGAFVFPYISVLKRVVMVLGGRSPEYLALDPKVRAERSG